MNSFALKKYYPAVGKRTFNYGSVPWLESGVKTKRYYAPTKYLKVGKIKHGPEKILRLVKDRLTFSLFTRKTILKFWKSPNILTYECQFQTNQYECTEHGKSIRETDGLPRAKLTTNSRPGL